MTQVVFTKDFNNCLRKLAAGSAHGKRAVQKCRAAIAEAGMDGAIKTLARTHHGESRADVEKYELGDGQRLVVQLVDGKLGIRAFLFAGDHEDSERWLNNHRGYEWVRKASDGTLTFTPVSTPEIRPHLVPDVDIESPAALLSLPLLRDLTADHWKLLGLAAILQRYAAEITAALWEQDASGIIAHIETVAGTEKALLLCDLLDLAHKREWDALFQRLDLAAGAAQVVAPAEVAASMMAPANSETFVTWEDASDLPLDGDWADWMLFLHAEQRKLAKQDFTGAARLRGVSGSGKTCVLLHRAKYLAKKYHLPVRIITLTGSTQKLLSNLISRVCGVESHLIHVSTMATLAVDVLQRKAPGLLAAFLEVSPERIHELELQAVELIRKHADFDSSPLKSLSQRDSRGFIIDELNYVRSRLQPSDYEIYATKQFKRYGRKIALVETSRRMFLEVVRWWDQQLLQARLRDHQALIAVTLEAVAHNPGFIYRSILVDEVQDLSQLEVALLSRLNTPDGQPLGGAENGLFLVGDGAQTIYKKGFSLASIGVTIATRSYVLQKNYRNTREILAAAFGLIATYEFADVDEDNIQRPTEPHYSRRHGEKPCIIKCDSPAGEMHFVARHVQNLVEAGHVPGQMCVIGFSRNARELVMVALEEVGIPVVELRDDADFDSPRVKVSTVESAKGHEFSTVFVVGLNAGVIPSEGVAPEDVSREASRLYVAMTRARDSLYLSYVANETFRPSEFLLPIADDCVELEYTNYDLRKPES